MKVLVIAHNLKFLLIFREQLLDEFIGAGHQVGVCSPTGEPEFVARLQEKDIEFLPVVLARAGVNLFEDLSAILNFYKQTSKFQPDVVFNIAAKPVLYGTLVSRLLKVPNIYSLLTGLGYVFLKSNFKEKVVNLIACVLFRLILPFNSKVFFQNPDDRSLFISAKFINDKKAVLVNGSGVDLDYYSHVPLEDSKPVFLMIARLIRSKGVVEYVEAAKKLKTNYPDAVFRLVGGVDLNPSSLAIEQINQWHQEGWIEYCGETNDVRPFITQSLVYVLPSFYMEGVPRSILEALSIGRPVITTDFRGCRETVVHGENGFLVPIKDVDALANAMEHFILNPDDAIKMGQASREMALQKFDVKKVNNAILREMDLIKEES